LIDTGRTFVVWGFIGRSDMRIHLASGLAIVCAAQLVAAQTGAPANPTKTPKTNQNKPITLTGCVTRSESSTGPYTLSDATAGAYRLTGVDVRDYVGRRVQIVGGSVVPRRLSIVGGLQPSANVAAQAGNIDPARAATAAAGGSAGPGSVQLPEFKVKSVRPVSGSCPD
jgi:hypothetical protein